VTVGAEVEHTLEKVRVLGQASNAEIAQMSELVTKLGQGAHGPRDVAQAFSVLTLAGLNAKEAMRGVGAALDLALTGDVSVEKASETLVQVATALGYTSKSFNHIADVIAKTAAVSMSSVESISASFMSASAAGEVYGARLQDMGLGLAALANLGVKATAAGTALKNFYKDISSGTDKTTKALAMMGLTLNDLKGADGKFIPLYDMILKMDAGMGKLQPKVRSLVMDMVNGERGIKQSASLMGLLYSEGMDKSGKVISKLQQMNEEIHNSATFASMAALAMAQTTQNQMKAVGNTLQTSFVEVFKSVSPEIGVISRDLKKAFGSKEFIDSLRTLIVSLATITKALVDNGRTIATVIVSVAALKIGVGALGGAIALARGGILGITAIKTAWAATTGGALVTALGRAGIAVRLFQASLGPLGLAIAALTTLWVMYQSAREKAVGKPIEQENLRGMVGDMKEKIAKEQKELALQKRAMAEGTTYERLLRGQEVEDQRKSYDAMIAASDKAVTKLEANAFRRGAAGVRAAKAARAEHNALVADLNKQHAALVKVTSEKDKLHDEEAQRLKATTGNVGMPEKMDKAALNAAYFEAIQKQESAIANARSKMEIAIEHAHLQRKAGLITELDMVHAVGEAEAAYHVTRVAAVKAEADIAKKAGRGADRVKFEQEAVRAQAELEGAAASKSLAVMAATSKAHEAAMDAKIRSEEKLGNYRSAAELKWGAANQKAYEEALQNAEKYGGDFVQLVHQFEEQKAAAIAEGALKQEVNDFDIAVARTQNTLKGFKADNVGKSWIEVWKAATKATARYNEELVEAQKEYADLRKIADAPGATDSALKAAEEAQGRLLKLSENFRQMWVGTGEQIAKGMEAAFGKTGAQIGELIKISADYQAQKDKSFESDMAHYGNLAGSAKGFFDEQSKGYKVLNRVAQAFHIASMARTLVQTAASVAAGAAQFFAQSGWAGFAGVAAMGAVMAGLGYAVSGGGGSGGKTAEEIQKAQGTGSVFGDAEAKSKSIMESMEFLKENANEMLPLTQGMYDALKNIEASMTGLTNLVLRTDGVANGTNMGIQTGTMKRSGDNLSTMEKTLLGVNKQGGAAGGAMMGMMIAGPLGAIAGALLGGVLGSIAGKIMSLWGKTTQKIVDSGISFKGSVDQLQNGAGYNQYASVDTTKSSWFGLSKKTSNTVQTQGLNDELSQQFGLIFTNLEDALKLAGTALGKSGDDVASAINNLVIDTSVSLKGLKGEELQDALNGVISKTMDQIAEAAFPAMGAFRQVGEGYAETVIRVASSIEQANYALEGFGITAIAYTNIANKTGDVAFEIAKQSIVLAEAGSGVGKVMELVHGTINDVTSAYKTLTAARKLMADVFLGTALAAETIKGAGGIKELTSSLDTYYEKYFSAQEKVDIQTANLTENFNALGFALPSSRGELRKWIQAAAESGNQLKVGQLLALAGGFDTLSTSIENLKDDVEKNDPFKKAMEGVDKAFDILSRVIERDRKMVEKAYEAAKKAEDKRHEAALKSLEDAAEAQRKAVGRTKEAIDESVKGIESILKSLESAIAGNAPLMTQAEAFADAMSTVRDAMTQAAKGVDIGTISGLDGALGTLAKPSDEMYSTALEYNRARAATTETLRSLQSYGATQLTEAQRQLAVLEKIDADLKAAKDAEDLRHDQTAAELDEKHAQVMAYYDAQLEAAKAQVDALNGINISMTTLSQAMANFRVAAASAASYSAPAAPAASAMAGVESLYNSLLSRKADAGGMAFFAGNILSGKTDLKGVAEAIQSSPEYQALIKGDVPQLAVGTNFVPDDMLAMIHKGERIIPAADNAELEKRLKESEAAEAQSLSTSSLEAKLDELIDSTRRGDVANVQAVKELFKEVRDRIVPNIDGSNPDGTGATT
jgi:TP901 family phage tail tape measure protein